jgi:hypothetical protein
VEFGGAWTIETIGPLCPEFLVPVLVSLVLAAVLAKLVAGFVVRFASRGRRIVYGGLVAVLGAFVLLMAPSFGLRWLYSLRHPNGYADPYLVWPGLLFPVTLYACRLSYLVLRGKGLSPVPGKQQSQ